MIPEVHTNSDPEMPVYIMIRELEDGEKVHQTIQAGDHVLIDLDDKNKVVGIELLDFVLVYEVLDHEQKEDG